MLRDRRRLRADAEPEVNPMEGVGNLADVMLVLAVGIMIALVAAWNVDLYATTPTSSTSSSSEEKVELEEDYDTLERTDEEIEESEDLEDYGLTEYGMLYQDEDGNLWIVGE
ncbi:MAG: DUF2149 domain-containing protein [Lachnospiraceae bacterium]|nr:DUF2149 domain-containing protein [Lachnospiraceae bacterium]